MVEGVLDGVFSVYAAKPQAFDAIASGVLEDPAVSLGVGIGRLRDKAMPARALSNSIDLLANVVESRDPYTAGHQTCTAAYAEAIGPRELGLAPSMIEGLSYDATVHGLGKISVLAEVEMALVRRHATTRWQIASHFEWPWPIAEMIHQQHERLNGSGCPVGLRGDQILLEARITAVAGVYEAGASRGPYRPAKGNDAAREAIADGSGTLVDADVVDVFLRVLASGFEPEEAGPDDI